MHSRPGAFGSCLLVLCLFLPCASAAQGRAAAINGIKATFGRYWDAVQRKDHEATLSYIDPRIYTVVPKDRMLDAMERSSADTTIRVDWGSAEVVDISKPFEDAEVAYAKVDYRFDLRMWFSSDPDTDEERKAEFMTGVLEEEYGQGRVRLEPDGTYVIMAERSMIAIRDPKVGDWRFLERRTAMEPVLVQIIPAKVLSRLDR